MDRLTDVSGKRRRGRPTKHELLPEPLERNGPDLIEPNAGGSVSDRATLYGRERGITVIDGGCPCMLGLTADNGHKAMKVFATLAGNIPKKV